MALQNLTEQEAREAAEDGGRAVDSAFINLLISISKILGYAVNVILEDRNKDGVREMHVEPNMTGVAYGYSLVR